MACSVSGGTLVGVQAEPVGVEVDLARRLPQTVLVGLPDSAVRESVERVRSAILAAGCDYPKFRVTVNLVPADLRKEGSGLDLPIAVAILGASGQLGDPALLSRCHFAGELSLSGRLLPVRGALNHALLARRLAKQTVVVPHGSGREAAVVPGLEVIPAEHLAEVVAFLRGEPANVPVVETAQPRPPGLGLDLAEVRGQALARRALEIAAAGGHHLLLVGPPGGGKTMLAARLPSILPPMSFEEAVEVTCVHSAAGLVPAGSGLVTHRPFRAPHHTLTTSGMVGSRHLRPGELSLAHHGVLFLDEIPEFPRQVLEILRVPLEQKVVRLSRAAGSVTLPSRVMLVAAANPCPCGYLGHPSRPCGCTEQAVRRYRERLSGPLLDRIDLHVAVQTASGEDLLGDNRSESSVVVAERVSVAREIQRRRYCALGLSSNADLEGASVDALVRLAPAARQVLQDAVDALGLSGRACHRALRVARTIADLEGAGPVELPHIAEALAFRAESQNS